MEYGLIVVGKNTINILILIDKAGQVSHFFQLVKVELLYYKS